MEMKYTRRDCRRVCQAARVTASRGEERIPGHPLLSRQVTWIVAFSPVSWLRSFF